MNAWHKALQNVLRIPMAEVHISCSGRNGKGRECYRSHEELDALNNPTKLEAIKNAKAEGWTYDKDGNWICPECTKNNNKPTIQGG